MLDFEKDEVGFRHPVKMTRLEAIQDIRNGMGICVRYQGHFSRFLAIIRRNPLHHSAAHLIFDHGGKRYVIRVQPKQVLSFIRRHYPKKM